MKTLNFAAQTASRWVNTPSLSLILYVQQLFSRLAATVLPSGEYFILQAHAHPMTQKTNERMNFQLFACNLCHGHEHN